MNEIKIYPSKPKKIYFFATCLIDLFYPAAGLAGIDLIKRENIEVDFPLDQTCCGQPAFTSGYTDEARKVASKQLSLFNENYPIIVPSGSCASMMKIHYPKLFLGTEYEELAQSVANRVLELTEFLVYVCKIKLVDKGDPISVAIHTSCSARRELGLGDTAMHLIGQLEQVTIKQHERTKECCGFGGTFAVRHGNISGAMVEDKVKAIATSEANTFISGDCGCLMNINGALEKQKGLNTIDDLESGEHIASFLWKRTNA